MKQDSLRALLTTYDRASTCLTNESVLQEAKKSRLKKSALLKLLFNIGNLYQKNDHHHSTSKSRRLYFGLTYGLACYKNNGC